MSFALLGSAGFLEVTTGVAESDAGICDLAVRDITAGWYPVIKLDQYWLKGTVAYRAIHYVYDLLLVGHDDNRKVFEAPIYDLSGAYKIRELPDGALREAIVSSRAFDGVHYSSLRVGAGFRGNLVDGQLISDQIEDYLHSRRSVVRLGWAGGVFPSDVSDDGGVHGKDACRVIIECVRRCAASGGLVDLRMTRQLWEMKAIMFQRCRMLSRWLSVELAHESDVLAKCALAARELHCLAVAARCGWKTDGLLAQCEVVDKCLESETAALETLIDALRSCRPSETVAAIARARAALK